MAAAVLPHEFRDIAVDAVTPHPLNPRIGDTAAIGESIESTGFFGAIVVHKATMQILVGNHRWEAAKGAGIKKLPAVIIDCDEETARTILVADNQYAALATWDEEALVELLNSMAATDAGLVGSGFTEEDLAVLVARMSPDLPGGFEELTPKDDEDDDQPRMITCPECGAEFEAA